MSASQRACRKLMEWLNYCKSIGWKASDMRGLTDIWWKYHDEQSGELVLCESQSSTHKEE